MNSTLVEDVQPWTNAKEQAKEPLSVIYINIINVVVNGLNPGVSVVRIV